MSYFLIITVLKFSVKIFENLSIFRYITIRSQDPLDRENRAMKKKVKAAEKQS